MKLFGYYWKDSESGLARRITPTFNEDADVVWVPQDRTTMFRKLPYAVKGTPEHPRRCIFTVEEWLGQKPEFKKFREAVFGKDYV